MPAFAAIVLAPLLLEHDHFRAARLLENLRPDQCACDNRGADLGRFAANCNKEMVGLSKLDDAQEIHLLHGMIFRHAKLTGSKRAEEVLATWQSWVPYFVRVMPNDYKRVLDAQKRMRESGLTQEQAEMAAFEQNSHDLARLGGK